MMFIRKNFIKFIIFGLFLILNLPKSSQGIKDVKIVVVSPKEIIEGSDVILHCLYDMEDEPLYSVKWFYNLTEFFRYVPTGIPPKIYFSNPIVKIRYEKCNNTIVVLRNFTKLNNGNYFCEVSADAPSFQTIWKSTLIKVSNPKTQSYETTTDESFLPEVSLGSCACLLVSEILWLSFLKIMVL